MPHTGSGIKKLEGALLDRVKCHIIIIMYFLEEDEILMRYDMYDRESIISFNMKTTIHLVCTIVCCRRLTS